MIWVALASVVVILGVGVAVYSAPAIDAAFGAWALVSVRPRSAPPPPSPPPAPSWPSELLVPTYYGSPVSRTIPESQGPLAVRDVVFVCRALRVRAELHDLGGRLRATVEPDGAVEVLGG